MNLILPTQKAFMATTSMVANTNWVQIIGSMGPAAAMLVFAAPYPTLQQVSREKSTGSLPLLPYSSMIANCFLWTCYGLLKHQSKVWATNMIGLILGIVYFFKFCKWAPPKSPALPGSIRQHAQGIVTVAAVALALSTQKAANLIGNLGVAVCLLMFASPLASLQQVIRQKSAASIPLPFTVATIANCFCWTVFGWFDVKDINIYLPNGLGLVFGLIQASLKAVFWRNDHAPGSGDGSMMGQKLDPLL